MFLKNLDKPDLVTSIFSELGGETCLNHHLVFAINEMKYVWRLKDQIKANDIKLKNFGFLYQSFLNNKENPTFRFKLYVKSLSESCADGVWNYACARKFCDEWRRNLCIGKCVFICCWNR
jgi:hypothetical protein